MATPQPHPPSSPPPSPPRNDPLLTLLNNDPRLIHPPFSSLFLDPENTHTLTTPTVNTQYYDTTLLKQTFQNTKHPILASINIQSLQSKHSALASFLSEHDNIHILALQETWNLKHPDTLSIPQYTLIHKHRPHGNGGGIGFYIKSNIHYNILHQHTHMISKIFECLTIEITINSKKTAISTLYRSPTPPNTMTPTTHMDEFNAHLDTLLQQLSTKYTTVYICLDSNINSHTVKQHHTNFEYFNTIHTNGYLQCINHSTRIQGNTHSLIDHILTNSNEEIITTGTLILDISDHFMTFITLAKTHHRHTNPPTLTRKFTQHNTQMFREHISNLAWEDVLNCQDVDLSYHHFWNTFKPLLDTCIPLTNTRHNKNIHKINKHMTLGLLTSRNTKMKLHKLALTTPTQANISKYRAYRNTYNRLIRASKKHYFETELAKAKKNPKKTWGLLNEALNKGNSKPKIEKIITDNGEITDKLDIATEFNTFFAGAGRAVYNSIPHTNTTPEEYLPPHSEHQLHLSRVSQAEVVSVMRTLQSKASLDSDGLSTKFMKSIALEISIPLTHIFNLSLTQGKFPTALKTSKIVPIHKSGNTALCDNYRPIALLSSISKTLEKIVANKLSTHLENHKLLAPNQYGFQRFKNTEQHLLDTTNYISQHLNIGNYCIGVFLDLRKAFDVCSHDILLKKLKNKGVDGVALEWFASYLAGRTQLVDIGGIQSSKENIDISIIQGSILGPILFNIYIDDLPRATSLKISMFADDTAGLEGGKHLPQLVASVNNELTKIATWLRANKMACNTTKTKYIIFHTKGKHINTQNIHITFDNNEPHQTHKPELISHLERIHNNNTNPEARSYKLLGIHLDEHLTFEQNTKHLISKLSKATYCINRVKNILPLKALTILYHSLVHSHLTYCTTIASCTNKTNITKISKLQKKAIRIITNSTYTAHTEPLFERLNILNYDKLITFSQLKIMHSVHYNYAPLTLTSAWNTNEHRNTHHELRNAHDYTIPRAHYAFFNRMPLYTFPQAWNTAGPAKYHSNKTTFTIALKNELLPPPLLFLDPPLILFPPFPLPDQDQVVNETSAS